MNDKSLGAFLQHVAERECVYVDAGMTAFGHSPRTAMKYMSREELKSLVRIAESDTDSQGGKIPEDNAPQEFRSTVRREVALALHHVPPDPHIAVGIDEHVSYGQQMDIAEKFTESTGVAVVLVPHDAAEFCQTTIHGGTPRFLKVNDELRHGIISITMVEMEAFPRRSNRDQGDEGYIVPSLDTKSLAMSHMPAPTIRSKVTDLARDSLEVSRMRGCIDLSERIEKLQNEWGKALEQATRLHRPLKSQSRGR